MIGTLLRPWTTATTWRALAHLALDLLVGSIAIATVLPLVITSAALLIVFPVALLVSWILFLWSHAMATVERSRHRELLDLQLADLSTIDAPTAWKRQHQRLRSMARWKEIAYLLIRYPLSTVTAGLAFGTWAGSLALLSVPFWLGTAVDRPISFGLFDLRAGVGSIAAGLIGVAGLVLAGPWMTLAMAEVDRFVARGLLGRSERAEFQARVSELDHSRVAAVDSAEAERRRIERDLHDGAQQRLIAVAMELGVARQRLEHDPAEGRALVAAAHEEVKSALKELRDLVRGIHPVILEDRGLDAALSSIVARSPVPVGLLVDVVPRPSAAVESAAYFVVSEALANVARHSEANTASVQIARQGDRLIIEIADDGIGGADPDRGTGLDGLRERVAALDGSMTVVSPVGGPTSLIVEMPCGS